MIKEMFLKHFHLVSFKLPLKARSLSHIPIETLKLIMKTLGSVLSINNRYMTKFLNRKRLVATLDDTKIRLQNAVSAFSTPVLDICQLQKHLLQKWSRANHRGQKTIKNARRLTCLNNELLKKDLVFISKKVNE